MFHKLAGNGNKFFLNDKIRFFYSKNSLNFSKN